MIGYCIHRKYPEPQCDRCNDELRVNVRANLLREVREEIETVSWAQSPAEVKAELIAAIDKLADKEKG